MPLRKHKSKHGSRKTSKAKKDKMALVMGEFKAGTLRSSSGQLVTNRAQAISIALEEAGLSRKDK